MKKPKISIIIAALNMVLYIEETILSIINQNYDNLELIVIDGGSTDGTCKILKKYAHHFSHLLSEEDGGMYHAIKKGIELSSGDVIAWLNADDIYFPWTLKIIGEIFSTNQNVDWIIGLPSFLNSNGNLKKIYTNLSAKPSNFIRNGWFKSNGYGFLQQESMFWRRELYFNTSGLNLNYKLAADYELWTEFSKHSELWTVDLPLAAFRLRNSSLSKKYKGEYVEEVENISINFKKLPLFFRFLGKYRAANFFLRTITWKKAKIIHQNMLSEELKFEERYRSCSSLTLSQLFLEYSFRKKKLLKYVENK